MEIRLEGTPCDFRRVNDVLYTLSIHYSHMINMTI